MSNQREITIPLKMLQPTTQNPYKNKKDELELTELFVVGIGPNNRIEEYCICKKEQDQNKTTYFRNVLTDTKYQTSSDDKKEPIVLKQQYFLPAIEKTSLWKTIVANNKVTISQLTEIYQILNTDTNYSEKENYGWYDFINNFHTIATKPMFIDYCPENQWWMHFDNTSPNLIDLIVDIKTNRKIKIITGDKGIGKTTFVNHLNKLSKTEKGPLSEYTIFYIDYHNFISRAYTTKHIDNRINKLIQFYNAITASPFVKRPLFFVDNVNLDDSYFLEQLKEKTNNLFIPIILVSNQKPKVNLDDEHFQIIKLPPQSEEIQRKIFKDDFRYQKKRISSKEIDQDKIISIILACDNTNYMNQTDNIKNPKLGRMIIGNAYIIAESNSCRHLSIDHFIQAIQLDNIELDNVTKQKAIADFEELKQKTEEEKQATPKQKSKLFKKK